MISEDGATTSFGEGGSYRDCFGEKFAPAFKLKSCSSFASASHLGVVSPRAGRIRQINAEEQPCMLKQDGGPSCLAILACDDWLSCHARNSG